MGTDVVGTGLPWVEAVARSVPPRSFTDVHRNELPGLIARHGALAGDDLRGVRSLGFRIDDGAAFTWRASERGVDVIGGDADAETLIALSEATFSEYLHELLTASGAVRTGRARVERGVLEGWQRWEPAIQSLCSG